MVDGKGATLNGKGVTADGKGVTVDSKGVTVDGKGVVAADQMSPPRRIRGPQWNLKDPNGR
eukprot:259982-Prorocentrum_minimum.AAC.1